MTIDPQGFPLDLTGENPRNLVVNDTRTIAGNEDSVFVPDGGPFFTRTLVIQSGSKTLIPNVDYKCLHLLKDASVESGLDVSSVVMITNTSLSSITMNYQVIGGVYGDTVAAIRQLLENADNIEKSISWNSHVYAKPDLFEPAPHFVSGDDFSDWASVLNGIQAVERAILLKDVAAWESAFQYTDNLITNRLKGIDLTNFFTKSEVNAEIGKLALKSNVYTKSESNTRHYSKSEVDARIGDIDGNETYYTEREINAKFIETVVADAKYATKAEINRVDSAKADKSSVYTRVQVDDRFPLKTTVYNKDYIDATFVIKGTSHTKSEAEARYALKSDAYNKVDSDKRYALKSQIISMPDLSNFMSRDDADALYLKINNADVIYLRKTTADSLYAKHTDLEVINTLTKKFANYYTKTEADETFISLVSVNSLFLTKAQGSSLYYTKTHVTTTFATKVELASEVKSLTAEVAKKVDTTHLEARYYDSATTELKFYNKVETDAKFPTKSNLISGHYTKVQTDTRLKDYYTVASAAVDNATMLEGFKGRYTKTETDTLFYNRAQSDLRFTPLTSHNNEIVRVNTALGLKSDTSWVNNTFYNKTEIDRNHYTRSLVDTTFYSKVLSDARYQTKADYTLDIKKYALVTDVTAIDDKHTTLANDRYKKSETYSRSESDARYHNSSNALLNVSGANGGGFSGGVLLSNTHSSSTNGSSVTWDIRSDKVMSIYPTADTAVGGYRFNVYLKDITANTFTTMLFVHKDRIWHKAYGYLDAYFAKSADHYKKTETYTKTESDVRYYTKAYADSVFATDSQIKGLISTINSNFAKTATLEFLSTYHYNRDQMGLVYLTKTEIINSYYNKADSDRLFLTKATGDAEFKKRVLETTFTSEINKLKTEDANRFTKAEVNNTFATKASIVGLLNVTTARVHFPLKTEVTDAHYTKAQSDAKYELKGTAVANLAPLNAAVTRLNSMVETYKVGDIYTTTINHSSAAAVNVHHGYGTWERFSQGRTMVGYTSNGWVDEVVTGQFYQTAWGTVRRGGQEAGWAKNIGNLNGSYEHTLSLSEMPSHDHVNKYPYNKFAALSSDVAATYGWVGDFTSNGADNKNPHRELAVMYQTAQMLADATSVKMGGNRPHTNIQPSVVVGVWKRIK